MNADDKISAILRMEADAVDPSPAGWDAITSGIAARRRRAWWVRGGTLATAALTVAAVAFATTTDPSRDAIDQNPATPGPSVTATAHEPAPTPTTATTPTPFETRLPFEPIGAIWPLTTWGEVAAWEADNAAYPSLASSNNSALAFTRTYLDLDDAAIKLHDRSGGTDFYEVRRGTTLVTVLEVHGYGAGGGAPYVVRRATSESVAIASPKAGAALSSPVRAAGTTTYRGAEPAVQVTLRADGAGSAPVDLATGPGTTGASGDWSSSLPFRTSASNGSLLATYNVHGGDGAGLMGVAAVPVRFASAPPAPPAAASGTYVAIRDQRVAVLSTGSGSVVRFLNDREPGGGASHPDLSPDRTSVVWSQGTGSCGAALRTSPVTGGGATAVGGTPGGAATMPAWAGDEGGVYVYDSCAEGATPTIRLHDLRTGADRELARLADVQALTASADGAFVAWITGSGATLVSLDVAAKKETRIPAETGCRWRAVDIAEVTAAGYPRLITGHACDGPNLFVETRTPIAPGGDRIAEVRRDGMFWRVSYDVTTFTLLVSHGVEDAPPYVEMVDRNGTHRVIARDMDQASF